MKLLKSALAIALALSISAEANAGTITFTAIADQTFGVTGTPRPTNDNFLRTFGVSTVGRSSLEFDVSAISGPVTITNAVFTIAAGGSVRTDTLEVYAQAGNGITEYSDVTSLGALGATFQVTDEVREIISSTITSAINSFFDGSQDFININLKSGNEGVFSGADFCSLEYGSGACTTLGQLPQLTLTFDDAESVPTPGALTLLGLGVFGLGLRRRTA